MTQVVLRLGLLMDARFLGLASCDPLRANRASELASPSLCEHVRDRRVPMADDPRRRTARLKVKVVPGSSRNGIAELPNDLLRRELLSSWHRLPSLGLSHQRFSL